MYQLKNNKLKNAHKKIAKNSCTEIKKALHITGRNPLDLYKNV